MPFCRGLDRFVERLDSSEGVNADQIDLIGFCQSAALSYTIALIHPGWIRALALLSGFMPCGAEEMLARRPLEGKSVYVAHGRRDNIIQEKLANRSVELLKCSGARVTNCERDGGHKVSADCFSGLTELFG
jgi:phospholipase/carboxylesterase